MRLFSGDLVGAYRLLGMVGLGGMAEVWAVEHTDRGTRHALKVLSMAHPSHQKRLVREGLAQSHVSHANLLRVEEIVEVDGVPGLVMPFIDGLLEVIRYHAGAETVMLLTHVGKAFERVMALEEGVNGILTSPSGPAN